MVTLCITPEKLGSFYLCHVCKEHLASQDILKHLCSVDHYFNYLVSVLSYSDCKYLLFCERNMLIHCHTLSVCGCGSVA